MSRFPPRPVAAGTALLGVIGLLAAVFLFTTIPENPRGDGFVAGLIGIFVLLYVLVGLLALAEAGVLYLVTRFGEPSERSQRLLTAGAVAGGLAVVFVIGPDLATRLLMVLVDQPFLWGGESLLGIGLVLVPIGVLCTGLGTLLTIADTVRNGSNAETA